MRCRKLRVVAEGQVRPWEPSVPLDFPFGANEKEQADTPHAGRLGSRDPIASVVSIE